MTSMAIVEDYEYNEYNDAKRRKMDIDFVEPLLKEDPGRFVIFPLRSPETWKLYKDAMSTFWTAEELNLHEDRRDWETKLTDDERYFIKNVLAFFAGSDGIVMENLASRFSNEVQLPEARFFYAYQTYNEAIHSETYSLLIDNYITDTEEKTRLQNAIQTIPVVAEKAKWALKWITDGDSSFAKRLIAFAIVEGVFFSGSFCSIYWLKKRNLMPGLSFSNELISRDEGLHTDFAVHLYGMIERKLSQDEVHDMFKEAVEVEKQFIIESIPCRLIGMNADLMSEYIEFVADRLLVQLGYDKLWDRNVCPFDFMNLISLRSKADFFARQVSAYTKSNVGGGDGKNEKSKWNFKISDRF